MHFNYSLGAGHLLTVVDLNSTVCKLFILSIQTEVAVQTISFPPCMLFRQSVFLPIKNA